MARYVRRSIVSTIDNAQAGHIGGDLSVADILTALFSGVLRLDPANPGAAGRDRFILSKGHCAAALYSVLALRGFIAQDALATFTQPLSALNGHG
jgi:transketolase